MAVDVVTEVVIARPRAEVAAFAANPANAAVWYVNIKSAELTSPPPLRVGSQMAFVAQFLGKRLNYTYEVTNFIPGERLVMRTSDGPFPMETTYTWGSTPEAHDAAQSRDALWVLEAGSALYRRGNAQG